MTTANDKRVRTAYSTNQVMCESSAAERAHRVTKGEMDIKEVLRYNDQYSSCLLYTSDAADDTPC
eukprot:9230048-Pyramimonas_sp.AAC.1